MAKTNRIIQVTRTAEGATVVLDDGRVLKAVAKDNKPEGMENLIENMDGNNITLKTGVMLRPQ